MVTLAMLGAVLALGAGPAEQLDPAAPPGAPEQPWPTWPRESYAELNPAAPPDAVPEAAKPIEITAPLWPAPAPPPALAAAAAAPAAGPARWFLMHALQGSWPTYLLDSQRINVYGWTEGSYTQSSNGRINWPILFQSPTDQPFLNQNWLVIERPVVTTGTTEPTYGFRTDFIVPGSDARFVQQRGLFNGQTGTYQFDIYQFYAEAYYPTVGRGLDIKVGRVAVPYMAELTPNVLNPLFSHSYAYYYNPFTHTGVITTLKLTDEWSVGGWFTLGNDVFFDPAATGMFVGTLQWTSPDKKDTALLCIGISSGRFDVSESFSNQDHVDLVYTHAFNPVLSYILDTGIGWESNIPDIGRATWSWAVNYLTYRFTPRLSGTMRFELFDDPQGFRTGFEGLYTAVTAGVTFKPHRALMIRPELRYDYNSDSRPFGDKHGLFTAATDVIVRW
jgi:hypothetical protein